MDEMQGGTPVYMEPEMSDWELLVAMFNRPAEAFDQIARKPRYVVPIVMLGIGYLFYYLALGGLTGKLMQGLMSSMSTAMPQNANMPFNMGAFGQLAGMGTACCFPFAAAFSWFLWTGLMYLGAAIAGSRERFWPLFSALGYAWLPFFFAYIIASLIAFSYIPQVPVVSIPFPASGSNPNPQAINNAMLQVMGPAMDLITRALTAMAVVIAIFGVWYGYLATLAMEKTMDLRRGTAAAIVIILLAISLSIEFKQARSASNTGLGGFPGSGFTMPQTNPGIPQPSPIPNPTYPTPPVQRP